MKGRKKKKKERGEESRSQLYTMEVLFSILEGEGGKGKEEEGEGRGRGSVDRLYT